MGVGMTTEMTIEDFHEIPGIHGYLISEAGRVLAWTLGRNAYHGKLMKPTIGAGGYNVIRFRADRGTRIDKLVLRTFVGECPPGMRVVHLNHKRRDDRLENLAYRPLPLKGMTTERVI